MAEPDSGTPAGGAAAEPVVRRRRRPSLVWLVPLVAAVIGAWLAFRAFAERGPTITITFQSAENLEAGQTRIRYKGVEVGKVSAIDLSSDFGRVVVTAELTRGALPLLSENSRFWVVRARLGAAGVSGLGTLLSGAYIGMDPGARGRATFAFKGLENAPAVVSQAPGRLVRLRAERLGSLNLGSPVTFRQLRVGEVAGFDLDPEGREVQVEVLIQPPYQHLVRTGTRFWDAGGVDLSLDANGIRLRSDSLGQFLLGGIALENPEGEDPGSPAPDSQVFTLFPDRDRAFEKTYRERLTFVLDFRESVRGLVRGAPVEFRGVKVGEVTDLSLEFWPRESSARVPVTIVVEPERLSFRGARPASVEAELTRLVGRGLRAQLKTGSLLTGSLYIDLDFHPGAAPVPARRIAGHPEIPTLPAGDLLRDLTRFTRRLQDLPLEDVAGELRTTLPVLRRTLEQAQGLVARLDTQTEPQARAALAQLQSTLAALEGVLRSDSPAQADLRRALEQLDRAARALRDLADTLERHPESLLRGKGGQP